ncbi:MAG: phytoene/squalene synthase family protein [bacterium]
MKYTEYDSDVKLCTDIHKKYGKSFYFGTRLLSEDEQDATSVLYAFFRYPDEYVDTYYKDQSQKGIALEKLQDFSLLWQKTYDGEVVKHEDTTLVAILRSTKYVFDTYKIPFKYSQDFLKSMIQDVTKDRYSSYEDLREYMYGSASVVGMMMCYILCFNNERFINDEKFRSTVLEKASLLGEAFQMTNFLRDVGEDVHDRGRIYIPQRNLERFGVSETSLAQKNVTSSFVNLMQYEISQTRQLYRDAEEGIRFLPKRAGRGIFVARVLYGNILDEIERNHYDSLTKRARVSFAKKIILTIYALIKFSYGKK